MRRTAGRGTGRPILVLVCALLALTIGFAGTVAGLDVEVPSNAGASAKPVDFDVYPDDTAATLAQRLRADVLIRNDTIFVALAHLAHGQTPPVPGVYYLSARMSMSAIATHLYAGRPDGLRITIPPGLRAAQYPALFAGLPRFAAADFLRIATTGTLPAGTLASRYWYVPAARPGVPVALEGYLLPGTYVFDLADDAAAVADQLVGALGERLCPGPDPAHPDANLHDRTQCRAHGAPIAAAGQPVSIFDALEHAYGTTDDVTALARALTLASIAAREAPQPADLAGVARIEYAHYRAAAHHGTDPAGDDLGYLDADATAQYARDTDHPPANGAWWAPLTTPAGATDPANPYNTAVPSHRGLPPGPIAAPSWAALVDATLASQSGAGAPPLPGYFAASACGATDYAQSAAEYLGVEVKVRADTAAGCPAVLLPKLTAPLAPATPLLRTAAAPPAPPATTAAALILLDPATGQVYLAQHADDERAMASTTKMMTALVALTYGHLDQRITIGADSAALVSGGVASVAGLQQGEVLTLRELLYGLLLPSGDDAAVAIADGVVGSQAGYVYLMNDEARALGLTEIHFADVHGLDAPGHYSSARDLARLAAVALANPDFAAIVGTGVEQVPATAGHPPFTWKTTNDLVLPPAYPGILGVKTGFTGNAGYCLVFAAQRPSGRLVGVVLGEPVYDARFTDAAALLDWGFEAQPWMRRMWRASRARAG